MIVATKYVSSVLTHLRIIVVDDDTYLSATVIQETTYTASTNDWDIA
jgi:hypothetical protein